MGRYLDRNPFELPFPIARLCLIAGGILSGAPAIALDEPTASLDLKQRAALAVVVAHVCAQGRSVLIVSHDHDFVAQTCDMVIEMKEGRVLGTSSGPFESDELPTQFQPATLRVARTLVPSRAVWRRSDLVAHLVK